MSSLKMEGQSFDSALRMLMKKFRLPGEAQKIDRILDEFARVYCVNNPGVFRDSSTAFVLAFSLIMLNTDAHNPAVKKKMTLHEFLRNNRGIDAGCDLSEHFLKLLYFEIKCNEIKMDGREGLKSGQILKNLVGAEGIKSKFVAEFKAYKVLKNTKHERVLFLFGDSLIVRLFP
jgi:brefeldin A-inhibited guanine nucleotide-exchange protein